MKLELVNFRCWKKKTFEFPDEGLVLLSGSSGGGKTSILSSIYFVLYGIGTKIISFGEKKCSVRFVYGGLDITRTKGPNRLTLSDKTSDYEDEVAQSIITKRFGTNFTLTSYITQKTVQSFLNLGPTDKMNFLEQLALGEEDISGIKKKTKEKIKERKETLQQKVGQLELLTNEIGEMKVPEEIPFPLGKKHSDIKIKNEGVFWKRTLKELEESVKTQKRIETEYSKEKVNKAVKENKQKTLDESLLKEDTLSKEIDTIEFDGDDTIVELKSTLSFLTNKREFSSISDRYNEEKSRYDSLYLQEMTVLKDELSELKERIDSIDKKSFSDSVFKEIDSKLEIITRIESMTKEISIHEKNRDLLLKKNHDSSMISKLEETVEQLQREIVTTEQRVDIKCCPNCKTSLRFVKTKLVVAEGEPVDEVKSKIEVKRIKTEISNHKSTIDTIKKDLDMITYHENKITDYKEKLNGLTQPKETMSELKETSKLLKEKKRDHTTLLENFKTVETKISKEDLSPTLKKFKLQVEKKKKELADIKDQLEEDVETDYTEEELRDEISRLQLISQKIKSMNKQLSDLKISNEKLKKEIDKIILSERSFEDELEEVTGKIDELTLKEKDHKETDKKLKLYLQYMKELEDYTKWIDKLQKCKEEEELAKKELSYTDIFLRKIQEAEGIAISQTIDQINYNMNLYLEKFFPVNPITVQISPYKETKKDIKPVINITVGYKGVDTDINSLSGGEYDRVTLSIVLALNSMFGSNLIMLDESISSLDAELSNEIIEALKETMSDKLMIVVAHQINEGMFDGVVNVEE